MEALKKKKLTSNKAYYVGVNFDDTERVKSIFYSGDLLLKKQNDLSQNQFELSVLEFLNKPEIGFFTGIDEAISNVVGEINCHRVGQGFGKNRFHISYHFRKDCFFELMNKLKDFFDYLEISDIVKFFDGTDKDEENHRFVYFKDYEKVTLS